VDFFAPNFTCTSNQRLAWRTIWNRNLPVEEMIEAQRTEGTRLVEKAKLAKAARRVEAANISAALAERN
ncbi:hypothetical protein HAX54_048873, partial [Datura stramonium]|nr:hypothetical protein [Datura stramonium]